MPINIIEDSRNEERIDFTRDNQNLENLNLLELLGILNFVRDTLIS